MTYNKNDDVAGGRQKLSGADAPVPPASPARRDFLIAAGVTGAFALGSAYVWRRWREDIQRSGFTAEYAGPSTPLAELARHAPFDVCIVGSGPAGVALGIDLARGGLKTLIVEAGVSPSQMTRDARFALLNQCTSSGDRPYPLVTTHAMMPGGTTSIWTGNSPRLLPADFAENAYTPTGMAWPISYESIEPYYERAEETLQVSGEADAPYLPPRRKTLAYRKHDGNIAVRTLLAQMDIASFDTLYSTTRYGGPVRVARDLLPVFAAEPKAVLVCGATARRFEYESGHIETCVLQDFSGRVVPVSAKAFVLAAGGAESARRLLLSRCAEFPHGLGNHSDYVGRHFADHMNTNFSGVVRRPRDFDGRSQTVRSYQYYEASKKRGLGAISLTVSLRRIEEDSSIAELRVSTGLELYPSRGNRLTLDPATRDPFGDPTLHLHFSTHERDRATAAAARQLVAEIYRRAHARDVEEVAMRWAHHHLTTVPMGADPAHSVVDPSLRVHGVSNLYVLSSGNFVTSGPANPTLLIVALAHRLAALLVTTLQSPRAIPAS